MRQALYAQRVSLPDGLRGTFEVTCVIAREIGAPPGVKPIEWRLLSNRTAETLEAVVELIDRYRARWEIELLFLVLKEGCRIEALSLSAIGSASSAPLRCSWLSPGASPARSGSDERFRISTRPCSGSPRNGRPPISWEKMPLPEQPPRLNEVLRLIARLGGFLVRKSDGEPGVKSVWLGLQRVVDFAAGIEFAREANEL